MATNSPPLPETDLVIVLNVPLSKASPHSRLRHDTPDLTPLDPPLLEMLERQYGQYQIKKD